MTSRRRETGEAATGKSEDGLDSKFKRKEKRKKKKRKKEKRKKRKRKKKKKKIVL